jgi:hypothetical protein
MDESRSKLDSHSAGKVTDERKAPHTTPRWVKVFVAILIVFALLFVILHLTGHGMHDHLHSASLSHRVQLF